MQKEIEPEILTAKEAAQFLQFNEQHVRRMANKGLLPGLRVGRAWRFRKQEIVEWFRQGAKARKKRGKRNQSPVTNNLPIRRQNTTEIEDVSWTNMAWAFDRWRKTHSDRFPKKTGKTKIEKSLAQWMLDQKDNFLKGTLPEKHFWKLLEIEFPFFSNRTKWVENYFQTRRLLRDKGHFPTLKNNKALAQWFWFQKVRIKSGRLNPEKARIFNHLIASRRYSPSDNVWDSRFALVKDFKEDFKRFPSEADTLPQHVVLWKWLQTQQSRYRSGDLSNRRVNLLKSIEFDLTSRYTSWLKHFHRLKNWKSINGNRWPDFSSNEREERRQAAWCEYIRKIAKGQTSPQIQPLTKHQLSLLNQINFPFGDEDIF